MGRPPGAAAGDEERRRSRREFIRLHHPDVGGDPDAFVAGLREHDRVAESGWAERQVDTLARAAARWLHDLARLPGEARAAYRDGRGEAR